MAAAFVRPEALVSAVVVALAIPREALVARSGPKSRGRHRGQWFEIRVRQSIQFVLRRKTTLSFPEIGRRLGYDHSTVLNNCRVVEERLRQHDPRFLEAYAAVIRVWVQLTREERARRAAVSRQVNRLLDNPTSNKGEVNVDIEADAAEVQRAVPCIFAQPYGERAAAI